MTQLVRVRTTLNYGLGGPGLMTNYFGRSAGTWDEDNAQVAVDRVRDALIAAQGIFTTAQSWVISGEVDELTDTTGEVTGQFGVTARTGAGTTVVAIGPLPVGMLVRLKTDQFVSGRRLVGRQFFVPIQSFETAYAQPRTNAKVITDAYGTELLDAGLTQVEPYVWSRPRPATEVGPGRPAGPAREFRAGSSAEVTSTATSPNWVVLTSRRD